MKTLITVAPVALLALVDPPGAAACKGYQQTQEASVPSVDVQTVAKLLREKADLTVYDANGAATRAKYGVIPGAKLLTHYSSFNVGKELPRSKAVKLVFYCGGPRCSAAEKAARKAIDAGYRDVSVMKDGIKGWSDAGHHTEKTGAS